MLLILPHFLRLCPPRLRIKNVKFQPHTNTEYTYVLRYTLHIDTLNNIIGHIKSHQSKKVRTSGDFPLQYRRVMHTTEGSCGLTYCWDWQRRSISQKRPWPCLEQLLVSELFGRLG